MRLGKAMATGYAVEAAEQQGTADVVAPEETPRTVPAEPPQPQPATADGALLDAVG
jgi:hypothetical protein